MLFDSATVAAIEKIARAKKVEPAVLEAVAEIESAGQVTARVNGRQEPLIRWEGHYFDQRLTGAERARARAEGLASPKAGGIKNPASQEKRWDIIRRAAKINRQAALESFSIGLGQVMTAHWKALGFDSVEEMIELGRRDAAGQIALMADYCVAFDLIDELQRKDFTAFARGYNGPGFRKNAYHKKMAAAYRRITDGQSAVSAARGMLRMGSEGKRVRELQALLARAGYAVKVDGDYGTATRDAVRAFQKARRITVDGVVGPETFRQLEAYKQAPEENLGALGVTETKEAKEGAGIAFGGGAIEVARQQIEAAADKVSWIPGLEWLSTILTIIAVLLVLGGLGWVAWGWFKARRTDEGDIGHQAADVIDDDPVLA